MDKTKEDLIAAMNACAEHARHLIESADAVRNASHPNIAYHLIVLALEEIGRRELLAIQLIGKPEATVWAEKQLQDHIQKLFWCFFGANFFVEKLTKKALDSMKSFATKLHTQRLAGLYVGIDESGLSLPASAITAAECKTLMALAKARLKIVEAEKLREEIPNEERELQAWFLATTSDLDKRKVIFSNASMAKLAELKNVQAWARWLRDEFQKNDAESHAIVAQELERSRHLSGKGTKQKWKIRIRLHSDSHSIRPKALNHWNAKVDWLKLLPVSGAGKKNQLILEILLLDDVPIEAVWYFAWGVARHFVTALNIGTMGFWWWRLPEQVSRYYESAHDLERNLEVRVERQPILKVDWGEHRVLTEADLDLVATCFAALPRPEDNANHPAYNHYISGVTFLSLNDVHFQCESTAMTHFVECLRTMMATMSEWQVGTPFVPALESFLDSAFPNLDEDRERFVSLCRAVDGNAMAGVVVTLKDVSFAKIFCDAYFLQRLRPVQLEAKARQAETK